MTAGRHLRGHRRLAAARRRARGALATVLLALALGPAASAMTAVPDCADPAVQPREPPAASAVLAAHAIWLLSTDRVMDRDSEFILSAAAEDRWLGPDKLKHFGLSAMLTLSTQYFLVHRMDLTNERAWPVAAGTALAFGLFKELADSQRPRDPLFSWRDMAANLAGVSLALAIILL